MHPFQIDSFIKLSVIDADYKIAIIGSSSIFNQYAQMAYKRLNYFTQTDNSLICSLKKREFKSVNELKEFYNLPKNQNDTPEFLKAQKISKLLAQYKNNYTKTWAQLDNNIPLPLTDIELLINMLNKPLLSLYKYEKCSYIYTNPKYIEVKNPDSFKQWCLRLILGIEKLLKSFTPVSEQENQGKEFYLKFCNILFNLVEDAYVLEKNK